MSERDLNLVSSIIGHELDREPSPTDLTWDDENPAVYHLDERMLEKWKKTKELYDKRQLSLNSSNIKK